MKRLKSLAFAVIGVAVLAAVLCFLRDRTVDGERDLKNFQVIAEDGVMRILWDSGALIMGDRIELQIEGEGLKRDVTLPAREKEYMFSDGRQGEPYRFTAQVLRRDHSRGAVFSLAERFFRYQDAHGLPTLVIRTENGEMPGYVPLETPEGLPGRTITENEYVPGQCTLYNFPSVSDYSAAAKLRVRGNTSAQQMGVNGKLPYKLVLGKAADLFGDGAKEKKYLLLSAGENMKTWLGFSIAELMGIEWTLRCRFVNLVLNDDWRGIYLLTEALDGRRQEAFVANDGLFVEKDAYWWKEPIYLRTRFTLEDSAYTIKYPEITSSSTGSLPRIAAYLEAVETGILEQNGEQFIDTDSFVKWILLKDILGNGDAAGSNVYYYLKHWNTEDPTANRLKIGPPWDFDAAFSSADTWSVQHLYPSLYYWLFQDEAFCARYIAEWRRIEPFLYEEIEKTVRAFCETCGEAVDAGREYNARRWKLGDCLPLEEEAEQLLAWLHDRIEWISSTLDAPNEMFVFQNPVVEVSDDCTCIKLTLLDDHYDRVQFPTWSDAGGQDDLFWYEAKRDENGNWVAFVDLRRHRVSGTYTSHAYVTRGTETTLAQEVHSYVSRASLPEEYIEAGLTADGRLRLRLITAHSYTKVDFPVWSDQNGQDDLVWYPAAKDARGTWTCTIEPGRHAARGNLMLHAYGEENGDYRLIDGISFHLASGTAA